MARGAPMKRQRAELGERKKDNYVTSKYIEKKYFLNGSKALPIKTVEQSLVRSKICSSTNNNYWYSESDVCIDTLGYYGVSVEVADKVKDPFFYERRRQAICYLFEAVGSPEEVVWEDEGIISDLMERLRINRNSRSSVMSILRDVLKSQDLGTSYQPCENNKRRDRPA